LREYRSQEEIPEELQAFMQGRRRHERVDSINEEILRDRKKFRDAMDDFPLDASIKWSLEKKGFTRRRKIDDASLSARRKIDHSMHPLLRAWFIIIASL
jgi:hypothetical protein